MPVKGTLIFKKEYREKILSGKKTCTIRLKTNLKMGDEAYIIAGGESLGVVEITAINRRRISELTDHDAKRDGFSSVKDLMRALKRHYRDLKPTTIVNVIHFRFKRRKRRQ